MANEGFSVFERLNAYRKKSKEIEKEEIQLFKTIAGNSLPRCIGCFKAGLRFCRFWLEGSDCEVYERQEQVDVLAERMEALL